MVGLDPAMAETSAISSFSGLRSASPGNDGW